MSISRFPLRDKVTLRLLKLYFNIADVAEWSRALDIRLSNWYCSGGKNKNLSAQRSNSSVLKCNVYV